MRNRLGFWFILALPVLLFAIVAVVRGEIPAFRDASHYYYPLYAWIESCWSEGHIPLWNPSENLGTPVVGDATSGVFYPGKLLFQLPGSFAARYVVFLAAHLLAAGLLTYAFAREVRASPGGAALAAVSYMLSGHVLFQHCNAVYLISAAWLPAALLSALCMLRRRQLRWALAFGATLALMTLGGDPQTAYHAGLAATLAAVLDWLRARRSASPVPEPVRGLMRYRTSLLAVAALSGGCLAAVQILPARQWASTSSRAVFDRPRTIYEIPAYLTAVSERPPEARPSSEIGQGLAGVPEGGEHDRHIYYFSVAPWRLAEWVWPHVFGQLLPEYRRWSFLLPAADRIWTPSLYAGFLPLLLALTALRFRVHGTTLARCWLSWMLLLSLLAAFGWYGIGWWINQALHAWRGPLASVGSPTGGLYWAMVVLLPGYAYFRFPAKWIVLATLSLSVLAGWGWTRLTRSARYRRRVAGAAFSWALLSLLLAVASYPLWQIFVAPIARRAAPDEFFGPLKEAAAYRDLLGGLLQTFIVSSLGGILLAVRKWRLQTRDYAVVILTLVELGWAHSRLVPLAEASLFDTAPMAQRAIEQSLVVPHGASPDSPAGPASVRVFRSSNFRWPGPPEWRDQGSDDRVAEIARWRYHTLFPRFHLLSDPPLAILGSASTLQPADWQWLMRWGRHYGPRRADGTSEPHAGLLRLLGTSGVLTRAPAAYSPPTARVVDAQLPPATALVQLATHAAEPNVRRAWMVFHWSVQNPGGAAHPRTRLLRSELGRWIREIYFPEGQLADLHHSAVITNVEGQAAPIAAPSEPRKLDGHSDAQLTLSQVQSTRTRVQVQTERSGMLILNDLATPGWQVFVRDHGSGKEQAWQQRQLLRANALMRAVYLEPGQYEVEFRYRPQSLRIGAIVSSIAWLGLLILGVRGLIGFFVANDSSSSSSSSRDKG